MSHTIKWNSNHLNRNNSEIKNTRFNFASTLPIFIQFFILLLTLLIELIQVFETIMLI